MAGYLTGPIRRRLAGRPFRMLYELRVENLLLMERAELRLAPGLNILTGETGAGKTLLAHALDLLLGGRRGAGSCARAPRRPTSRACSRSRQGSAGDDERMPAGGARSSCSRGACGPTGARARTSAAARRRSPICGSSVAALLSFYGQHEHRKLMLASRPARRARCLLRLRAGAAARAAAAPPTSGVRELERRSRRAARAGGRARARARPARVRARGDRGGRAASRTRSGR